MQGEAALPRAWRHSHEEDAPGEMVFRPADWAFPPSRGRRGFELRADGTAALSGPGPTDRPATGAGRWVVEEPDRLVLYEGDATTPKRVYRIVSISADRLVVRK
jgi:hypothetical protein